MNAAEEFAMKFAVPFVRDWSALEIFIFILIIVVLFMFMLAIATLRVLKNKTLGKNLLFGAIVLASFIGSLFFTAYSRMAKIYKVAISRLKKSSGIS